MMDVVTAPTLICIAETLRHFSGTYIEMVIDIIVNSTSVHMLGQEIIL